MFSKSAAWNRTPQSQYFKWDNGISCVCATTYEPGFSFPPFLIISTGNRQINPCSSLLINSWSFIQQNSAESLFRFPSLHIDVYILHTKKLSLNFSDSHSSSDAQVFHKLNMPHWTRKIASSILLIKREYQYFSLPLPPLFLFLSFPPPISTCLSF